MRAFLAAAVGAMLFGCGPRDSAYDPTQFHVRGVLAPADVVLPSTARAGDVVNGLYTIEASTGASCCWIARHAKVLVRKRLAATSLRIGVYIPAVGTFEKQVQRVKVTFPRRAASFASQGLKPGFSTISIDLPQSMRSAKGDIEIDLDSALDYNAGADMSRYSLILLSIYFE